MLTYVLIGLLIAVGLLVVLQAIQSIAAVCVTSAILILALWVLVSGKARK